MSVPRNFAKDTEFGANQSGTPRAIENDDQFALIIGGSVAGAVVLLCICAMLAVVVIKNKRQTNESASNSTDTAMTTVRAAQQDEFQSCRARTDSHYQAIGIGTPQPQQRYEELSLAQPVSDNYSQMPMQNENEYMQLRKK